MTYIPPTPHDWESEMYPKSSEQVKSPDHYTWHPSGVECKTIIGAFPHFHGAAMKYLWRAGRKGNHIEDLKKAIECIEIEIERLEND